MADQVLTPSYVENDFLSIKQKMIDMLKNTDTFKDYNFEGSNINMLIELVSYIGDLNNFYVNQVAQNIYPDTSNLYETSHSLVKQRGYQPSGYVSSYLDLKITIKRWNEDQTVEYYKESDQLYIPAWYSMDTTQSNRSGDSIFYSTTTSHTITLPPSGNIDEYSFLIPVKQGKYFTGTYSGDDIVNGGITLPFKNIDSGVFPYDETFPSLIVYVNETPWSRVRDFYDELSGLQAGNNVYKLIFDKYKRYQIVFSNARNMPNDKSRIRLVLLESLGINGTLGANLLQKEYGGVPMSTNIPLLVDRNFEVADTPFLRNNTKNIDIPTEQLNYTNESASVNGGDPETFSQIKIASEKTVNTQYRNVTKSDYMADLETRTDIIKASVWGEQEENHNITGNYNKVYISVIPEEWDTYTIPTSGREWIDPMVPDISQIIQIPLDINSVFQDDLKTYIEPKKIISTYEEFVLPELVYFKFEIGISPKRMYNFDVIVTDVKAKLIYYFEWVNREFNEIIDFKNIHNYIIDPSITSTENKFASVRGINNLIFRDIALYTTISNQADPMEIFQHNTDKNFPMFSVPEFDTRYENILKPIKLGLNQFPTLAEDMCIFINEG